MPEMMRSTFHGSLVLVNLLAFSTAFTAMASMSWIVDRTLYRIRNQFRISVDTLQRASTRNLSIGYWGSLICIGLWVAAGCLYPAILQVVCGGLPGKAWVDFIGSHVLAGLVTGAFSFVAGSWCALRFWQPVLFQSFLRSAELPRIAHAIRRLERLLGIYQFVAVTIPMLAVALLVTWSDDRSRWALSTLSIASVIGLPLLLAAVVQIRSRLAVISKMSR